MLASARENINNEKLAAITELKNQVAQGKSDEEILNFFEERYGEWVLLKPKPHGMNLAVWILPLLAIVGGAAFIISWVKKGKI